MNGPVNGPVNGAVNGQVNGPQNAQVMVARPVAPTPGAPEDPGSRTAVRQRDAGQVRSMRKAWIAARHAGYRPGLGWLLAGLVLMALGLALPWFAIPLQAGQSAWSLHVMLAGAPFLSPVSYGAVLAGCLGLAALAVICSLGRPSAATAAAGALVLLVSLTFVVAAGTADWPLLQRLEDQAAEQNAIFQQFSYTVPGQQPAMMLLVPVTGAGALVGGALRLGWFCTAAGGVVLVLSGVSRLANWVRRARFPLLLPPALALLLAAGVLGRGAAASYLAVRGDAAARAGNYQAAKSSLAAAHRLNPLLASSTAYDLALGQVMLAAGQRGLPLALLADADARGASGDIHGQVAELMQALARDPTDPVLRQQLGQASQRLALTDQDPRPLQALHRPGAAGEYTEGRIRYATGDYRGALTCFRRALVLTRDQNVISSAYTYVALSELKLGQADQARQNLLRAVRADTAYNNTLARSLVTGLYVADKSGDL